MRKLYRSDTDKKIAGICGGLSEMLSYDSTIIRLIFVFITVLTGLVPAIVAYIVGWLIIPVKGIDVVENIDNSE